MTCFSYQTSIIIIIPNNSHLADFENIIRQFFRWTTFEKIKKIRSQNINSLIFYALTALQDAEGAEGDVEGVEGTPTSKRGRGGRSYAHGRRKHSTNYVYGAKSTAAKTRFKWLSFKLLSLLYCLLSFSRTLIIVLGYIVPFHVTVKMWCKANLLWPIVTPVVDVIKLFLEEI